MMAEPSDRESARRVVGDLLAHLERPAGARDTDPSQRSERWIQAKVTENITVSARDLDDGSADKLEELAAIVRLLMPNDEGS